MNQGHARNNLRPFELLTGYTSNKSYRLNEHNDKTQIWGEGGILNLEDQISIFLENVIEPK